MSYVLPEILLPILLAFLLGLGMGRLIWRRPSTGFDRWAQRGRDRTLVPAIDLTDGHHHGRSKPASALAD